MQFKVKISRQGRVLHEGEYSVEVEGDITHAVADAMAQARKVQPGPLWDIQIDVRKVEPPSQL